MTKQQAPEYRIRRVQVRPELKGLWEGPAWKAADTLDIANVRPEGTDHQPQTRARLLYDDQSIYGIFHVRDRYVRSVQTAFQAGVCGDSCVEFFVQPMGKPPYFNFEFNCGGTLLCSWIEDPTRRPQGGFTKHTMLPAEDGKKVRIFHSMPRVVEPEIQKPTEWVIEFSIPFALMAKYAGPLGSIAGQKWRANLYKCGDQTSHRHWMSWSPVDILNFHLPRCFGTLEFER